MPKFTVKTFSTDHTIPEKKVKCEIADETGAIVSAGHGENAKAAKERALGKIQWPEGAEFVPVK